MTLRYGSNAMKHPPTLAELVPTLKAMCEVWEASPTLENETALFDMCMAVSAAHLLVYELEPGDLERTERLVERLQRKEG